MTADNELKPNTGWRYVGCPRCGYVTTVPQSRIDPPPRCPHNGSTTTWRDDVGEGTDWTRMVLVKVVRDG